MTQRPRPAGPYPGVRTARLPTLRRATPQEGDTLVPTDAERRRVRLSIAIAVFVCAAMLAVAPWRSAGAQAGTQAHMRMGGAVTAPQLRFRNAMRVLWEQHVAWTRLAIVSFNGGLPNLKST